MRMKDIAKVLWQRFVGGLAKIREPVYLTSHRTPATKETLPPIDGPQPRAIPSCTQYRLFRHVQRPGPAICGCSNTTCLYLQGAANTPATQHKLQRQVAATDSMELELRFVATNPSSRTLSCSPTSAVGESYRVLMACLSFRIPNQKNQQGRVLLPACMLDGLRLAHELRIPLELVQCATDIFSRYSDGEGYVYMLASFVAFSIRGLRELGTPRSLKPNMTTAGTDLFQRRLRMSNFPKMLCVTCLQYEYESYE